MIRKRKKGFALIFVVIILAGILGVFLRYSMNVRATKVQLTQQYSVDGLEESIQRSIGSSINETYILDQMITNKEDFDGRYNVKKPEDYFIVKDMKYEGTPTEDDREYIWESGGNNSSNSSIWKKINKTNSGGEISERYPGYYVGGDFTFKTENYSQEKRLSKGGYYLKSISLVEIKPGDKKENESCGTKYIYKADFGQVQKNDEKMCYVDSDGTTQMNESINSTVNPIENYLTDKGYGEHTFWIETRKDMAYHLTGTGIPTDFKNGVVAVFEAIGDVKIIVEKKLESYIEDGETKTKTTYELKDSEIINYEINHIGP